MASKSKKDLTKHYANRAIKYRIYPNEEQIIQIRKTFGCTRKVYNLSLDLQEEHYKNGLSYMSKVDLNNHCNKVWKKDFSYLAEVDKFSLTNSIYNLSLAYDRFFKHISKHPKYKSKHNKNSYTTNYTNNNIEVGKDYIKLPYLKYVKAKIHRTAQIGWVIKSATVSQEKDETMYCSVLYEYEENNITAVSNNIIGLDYKSDGMYMDSNGHCCNIPHFYRDSEKKLSKAQRILSRRQKKSNNYFKQLKKINKLHRKIANQRKDFLHKESTKITNLYDIVCIEDLNMKTLSNKGFGNGKATLDNGYGMFTAFLEYKLTSKGGRLIRVDKWFASSQICSCCGYKNPAVKDLSIRNWACPICGAEHNRDINAAINIKNEGIRILKEAI